MTEFDIKQDRIRKLLETQQLDALVLGQVSNFAWATCGAASYVNTAVGIGEATLIIGEQDRHLVTNNIEATRLDQEEDLEEQGWEFHVHPWYEPVDTVGRLTANLKVGADISLGGAVDLSGELAELRSQITPQEGDKFRAVGAICAAAIEAVIYQVQPGMSEFEIAALLAAETQQRGAQAIVNLIATDERIFKYRHPLPTEKVLERYAMLVLCGRRQGLVASVTRLVHFGSLPDELQRKAEAVAAVDAAFIAATRPGASLGEVFAMAQDAYMATGFSEEWHLHHQGGPASYEPRDFVATPTSRQRVHTGQAYAWNPSITGIKSEDTILVGEVENEVLTATPGWPMLTVEVDEMIFERPAVLERS